jgi:type III secretion control protein HpaP
VRDTRQIPSRAVTVHASTAAQAKPAVPAAERADRRQAFAALLRLAQPEPASKRATAAPLEREALSPAMPAPAATGPREAAVGAADRHPTADAADRRTAAAEPAALRRDAADPVSRQAHHEGTVSGIDPDTRAHKAVKQLVECVSDFCNDPAVRRSDGWTVRLELNPEILPRTELEMNLSPQWLLLRFCAQDPQSRNLVSAESPTLQRMLDDALDPKRNVSIALD